jgi:DNA-binding transcriptional LysR family regulator
MSMLPAAPQFHGSSLRRKLDQARNHLESWDDIQYVLAVARTGSFLAAGERLGTNASTVSRRIQRLEQRLETKLFDRYAHGMQPTPAGIALTEKAAAMEAAANDIERHLAGADRKMSGSVRIAVPDGIATYWLTPALLDFRDRNPGLCIELIHGSGPVDLLGREADVAIRLFDPKHERYVASRVGRIQFSLFASPSYLSAHGQPANMAQLAEHRIVDHSGYRPIGSLKAWHEYLTTHPGVTFRADMTSSFVAAVRAAHGIGLFPNFYRIVAPDLVPLDIRTDAHAPLWLLSHEETSRNARVRALLDFLLQRFRADRRQWFS